MSCFTSSISALATLSAVTVSYCLDAGAVLSPNLKERPLSENAVAI